MNTALWITQVALAVLFVVAGAPKLLIEKRRLAAKMTWTATAPAWIVKAVGVAELLGAAGLLLPDAFGVLRFLTPVAAGALFVLLLGAVLTKLRLRESPALPAVAGIAALVIVIGKLLTSTAP